MVDLTAANILSIGALPDFLPLGSNDREPLVKGEGQFGSLCQEIEPETIFISADFSIAWVSRLQAPCSSFVPQPV